MVYKDLLGGEENDPMYLNPIRNWWKRRSGIIFILVNSILQITCLPSALHEQPVITHETGT